MDAEGVEPISDYSYAFSLHLDSLDISTDCSGFMIFSCPSGGIVSMLIYYTKVVSMVNYLYYTVNYTC